MQKTIVIGLGEIGKPLYNIISRAENNLTIGIDIRPLEIADAVGIMHICIPFQLSQGFVQIVVNYARKYNPKIIVVNSTVTPGTTEALEKASGVPTVYSPVRGKHSSMEEELLHYEKFIAGNDAVVVQQVKEHFEFVGMKVAVISKSQTLELSKLLETTYFGLLISWAQEMERLARSVGGDYMELVAFFKEIPYLPPFIFQPGFIGGHCVMPNIELLKSKFSSEFLDAIKDSNEKKAKELAGNDGKLKERIQPLKI